MKLIKWLFSVAAVAFAVAGVVYLILTKAEWISDRLEAAADCIKGFFCDIVDRFFAEEDFCECSCGAGACAEEDICADCCENPEEASVLQTDAPAEPANE